MIIAGDLGQLKGARKNCQGMSLVFMAEDHLPSHCREEIVLGLDQGSPLPPSCLYVLAAHSRLGLSQATLLKGT